jgi:hypothetical protein
MNYLKYFKYFLIIIQVIIFIKTKEIDYEKDPFDFIAELEERLLNMRNNYHVPENEIFKPEEYEYKYAYENPNENTDKFNEDFNKFNEDL